MAKSILRKLKPGTMRKVSSDILVRRLSGAGKTAFYACVAIGHKTAGRKSHHDRAWKEYQHCAHGKNPREAISKALRSASKTIAVRSGAFARYK
mgnify:CR=1 FL=1